MWIGSRRGSGSGSTIARAIVKGVAIADDILEDAFARGEPLGEGSDGATVKYEQYVIKKFYLPKVRDWEEEKHLQIWRILNWYGDRKCLEYVCRPFKVLSKRFTLQQFALSVIDAQQNWKLMQAFQFQYKSILEDSRMDDDSPGRRKADRALQVYNRAKTDALNCLKKNGVHHNDLHDGNILVLQRGDAIRIKIIDFGRTKHDSDIDYDQPRAVSHQLNAPLGVQAFHIDSDSE